MARLGPILICILVIAAYGVLSPRTATGVAAQPRSMATAVPHLDLATPGGTVIAPPPTATPAVVVNIVSYDDGHASRTLYLHHALSLGLRYRVADALPASQGTAEFRVVTRGATVQLYRQSFTAKPQATLTVQIQPLLPGTSQVIADLTLGTETYTASASVVVLDPGRFLLKRQLATAAQSVNLRTSHAESDAQAERESYVVHLEGQGFVRLGRQTGTFQLMRYTWPGKDPGQVAMQAVLLSTFANPRRAADAYSAILHQHQLLESCKGCTTSVVPITADSHLGDQRTGFQLTTAYSVGIREVLFVRGPVLVEGWTYTAGQLSPGTIGAVKDASHTALKALDRILKTQEQ